MEVVAEGKITTYAKSSISSYQIKVDQIELQGEMRLITREKELGSTRGMREYTEGNKKKRKERME